jgi:hypothetical protein
MVLCIVTSTSAVVLQQQRAGAQAVPMLNGYFIVARDGPRRPN